MRPLPLALLTVLLLAATPAAAQAQGVAGGEYGGGAITRDSRAFDAGVGSSWMWARVGADGRAARIAGRASVACGLTRFDAEVQLAADGSFSFSRTRWTREAGHRLRAIVTVRGRFTGDRAEGTVRGRLRNRHPNGRVRRCSTRGARPWQLRVRAPSGPPGAAQADGVYYGLTADRTFAPRPFVLRVSGDARRVKLAIFDYTRFCGDGEFELNEHTPGARIRPDGTFGMSERFRIGYRRSTERFRVRVDGRFTAGGVTGSLRVTSVVRRRGSGRVIDRCDSRPTGFDARL